MLHKDKERRSGRPRSDLGERAEGLEGEPTTVEEGVGDLLHGGKGRRERRAFRTMQPKTDGARRAATTRRRMSRPAAHRDEGSKVV